MRMRMLEDYAVLRIRLADQQATFISCNYFGKAVIVVYL